MVVLSALGVHPGLLGHIVVVFLIFLETFTMLSIVVVLVCDPAINGQGSFSQ